MTKTPSNPRAGDRALDPAERAFRAAKRAHRKGRATSEQRALLREVHSRVAAVRRAHRAAVREARYRAAAARVRKRSPLGPLFAALGLLAALN